jgi:hypothetical protein
MENGMNHPGTQTLRLLSACMMTAAMGFAAPGGAAPPVPVEPPAVQVFPAGDACDFPVMLESAGSNYHLKEFVDKNGNLVRLLIAGKGSLMTLTNMDTDVAISLKAYGFSAQITGFDGTITQTITGHVLVNMLPTDVPAGPSLTLYVGQLIYTTDPVTGVGTIKSFTGKSTDICAALD